MLKVAGPRGALGFEWIPTAKWPLGAEAGNAKMVGWPAPFGAKDVGG